MLTIQDLAPELAGLDEPHKHRVIYRFLPDLRGMLFVDDALEGYFLDAVDRARRKGWVDADITTQAMTGHWKKPPRRDHP